MIIISKATIFKTTFDIPCDTYACGNQSKYAIGKEDGPPNMYVHICKECYDSITANSLPSKKLIKCEEEIVELKAKLKAQTTAVKEMTKLMEKKKPAKKKGK